MAQILNISAPDLDLRIDQGSQHTIGLVLPGSGDLTGTVTLSVESSADGTDVVTWTGTITDASARAVSFILLSTDTVSMPVNTALRYKVMVSDAGVDVVYLTGSISVKRTVQ